MPEPKEFLEQFFAYAHLPEKLQAVSKPFGDLAQRMLETLPRNPERTVALRKLLEAKDCAVRALIAVAVLFLLFPLSAFAQTVDPGPAPDLAAVTQQVFDAIHAGNWWLLASIVVSLLTWALRSQVFNRIPGPVGVWFTSHPLVGFATPFVLAAAGGLFTALQSHTPFTVALLVGEILKVGAGAVAAYIGAKKIAEASVIGAVARGEVTSVPTAISLLAQGPQKVPAIPAQVPLETAAAELLGKPTNPIPPQAGSGAVVQK